MLPAARAYLIAGKLSQQAAAYATIFSFLGGAIAIQLISRLLHHFTPSHVVGCDHSHQEESNTKSHDYLPNGNRRFHRDDICISEDTPLLFGEDSTGPKMLRSGSTASEVNERIPKNQRTAILISRPSLAQSIKKVSSLALGHCDENDPCFGFGDPCARECFKAVKSPTILASPHPSTSASRRQFPTRVAAVPFPAMGIDEESILASPNILPRAEDSLYSRGREGDETRGPFRSLSKNQLDDDELANSRSDISSPEPLQDQSHPHHHHVPTNAFLSIGLQTSFAIALHKLPEGFITFATNHANPKLGFTVFMALFIHNISEGFAMALPLYLALGSRWKSMLWSSLLGGISQPLGAGLAALWFRLAGKHEIARDDTLYGCMFAITAGVMTSVALSLFTEGIGLTHNRSLCIAFAFLGMGIMGISSALTAS
ncbi:hypothetical protein MMC31_005803 [Peltigera leucophlebia]|nr:hypothetical protein [Peltigera leucophlebia]